MAEAKPDDHGATGSAQGATEPDPGSGASGRPPEKPAKQAAKQERSAKQGKPARSAKQSFDTVRSAVATVVWVVAVLAALVLAAGALVVALDFNARNGVVEFLTETADRINLLGELKTFEPEGRSRDAVQDARTKEVLVNWGICAVAYLVGGKILDKLIRP
ncbi:hypothetical protein [Nocardioides caldifontis]|uniref:hypothetical protein n=1 Tax=Nocardioides caldifontis TaxID=2588938 RepID=UPI0011DFC70F|nr:hypothetical protein [Nocardioides caldifontis]